MLSEKNDKIIQIKDFLKRTGERMGLWKSITKRRESEMGGDVIRCNRSLRDVLEAKSGKKRCVG